MFRFLLVLALCAGIATSCGSNNVSQLDSQSRAVSAVNATNAWNSVCGQYSFIPKPFDTRITFVQGYYGSNFSTDFAAAKSAVAGICGVESPSGGNDVMKISIENWGQSGGGM